MKLQGTEIEITSCESCGAATIPENSPYPVHFAPIVLRPGERLDPELVERAAEAAHAASSIQAGGWTAQPEEHKQVWRRCVTAALMTLVTIAED